MKTRMKTETNWPRMAIAMALLSHLLASLEGLLRHHLSAEALSPLLALGLPSIACAITTGLILLHTMRTAAPETKGWGLLGGALLLAAYPLHLLLWLGR